MKRTVEWLVALFLLWAPLHLNAQTSLVFSEYFGINPEIRVDNIVLLTAPTEGLWSVSTSWRKDEPDDWQYVRADFLNVAAFEEMNVKFDSKNNSHPINSFK